MYFQLMVSALPTLDSTWITSSSGGWAWEGDVKQRETEPRLARVVAQKLPDGFSELVKSGASWHRSKAFASLLKQQWGELPLSGPKGPRWCSPGLACSINRAGTFICLCMCWPWCLFTAMISTPAQIGRGKGRKLSSQLSAIIYLNKGSNAASGFGNSSNTLIVIVPTEVFSALYQMLRCFWQLFPHHHLCLPCWLKVAPLAKSSAGQQNSSVLGQDGL